MVHLKVSYLFGCCMDLACILNRMRYQTGLGCVASGVALGDDSNDGRAKRYQQSKLANCVFTMALKVRNLVSHHYTFQLGMHACVLVPWDSAPCRANLKATNALT